jgi:protein-disulfide isomerase
VPKATVNPQAAAVVPHRRTIQIGAVLVFVAIVAGAAIAVSATSTTVTTLKPGQPVPGAAGASALLDGIPQHGLTLGNPAAPVTLVEFADLQCSFCAQYATRTLPALIRDYVRTGRVQMAFRGLAILGSDSATAARFAAATAQQNRLWNFLDLWYANQQAENSGYVTRSYLEAIATGVPGMNVGAAAAVSGTAVAQTQLDAANSLAGGYGIASTPSFLIGRTGGSLKVLSGGDLGTGAFTPAINQLLAGTTPAPVRPATTAACKPTKSSATPRPRCSA